MEVEMKEGYPTEQDYKQLIELGYPKTDPHSYYLKKSKSASNPGRFYWTYNYVFLFWADTPYECNPNTLQRAVEKRQREYEAYKQIQNKTMS